VDSEPAENKKKKYDIKALQNKIIKIKLTRVNKKNIIQCMRFQKYGNSKSYCNSPFIYVKCGGFYSREDCNKNTEIPAKCALCGDNHPAN
jgi:ribosomal protein S27E